MNPASISRAGAIAASISAILYVISFGAQFAGDAGGLGQPLYSVSTLCFLVVLVILYLELRSTAGLLAIITGVLSLIAGIALIAGACFDIFGLFNLVLSVPFIIWLVWLGRIWAEGRAAAAQPA